ncbi:MAG: type II secretion system protein, partial [Candidatus Acidiferrales bacterium]
MKLNESILRRSRSLRNSSLANFSFLNRSLPVPDDGQRGFTMLELMVVMAIILILATIGAGQYQKSLLRAKEAALKHDLFVMRQAIDQYTLDKEQAPQSLDDLVSAGYLREIPMDPLTRRKEWNTTSDEVLSTVDQTATGITDVHSTSD